MSLKIFLLFGLISSAIITFSQSLQHPVIWTTAEDRENILKLIETHTWAKQIEEGVHKIIDDKVELHQTNPSRILKKIPPIAADDNIPELEVETVHQHARILAYSSYAGLLFYLTKDEKYAQFSADILWFYAEELAPREPQNTSICGNAFYDPRTSYAQFATAYDFIYNFLKAPHAKVFSAKKGRPVDFDHHIMQQAVLNMVGNVLQEYGHPDEHGKFISNHPVLTAPGALFGILCVEDDTERERLFNVFWEQGTAHQNAFKNTILPMFGSQGIWPESTSYSFMPNVTMILNIVDRLWPEMNVLKENMHILDGNFLFDNLRMPDRRFVTYGDSHRNSDGTEALYRYTLNLAKRKGFDAYEQQAKVALRQRYDAIGGYQPEVGISTFDNSSLFTRLLWGEDVPEIVEGAIDFQKPTVIIEHAGIVLQRNSAEVNNEMYGLTGIIGGAHYVHSHVTGITMELYGQGYVMAPNAGLPSSVAQRRIPLHEHYFRLYAGNNTVIVNGTSHGLDEGSWKSKANVWQNTVVNIAAEPKHLEEPKNENFSFATQRLEDEVNNCIQERTLSTIRTSPTTGYYFDMFRSKSLGENEFHDYIYHNLGDLTTIRSGSGEDVALHRTNKYDNDIGDQVHSPGWKYFQNTKISEPTEQSIVLKYHVNYDNKYMHQHIPGDIEREYTLAEAPPSRDVKNGYTEKSTQVLVIRQNGEAWDRPYVLIHEPSDNEQSHITSVEHLYSAGDVVGVKVTSNLGNERIVDYILFKDGKERGVYIEEIDLHFSGLFGIARFIHKEHMVQKQLYLGEGDVLVVGEASAN